MSNIRQIVHTAHLFGYMYGAIDKRYFEEFYIDRPKVQSQLLIWQRLTVHDVHPSHIIKSTHVPYTHTYTHKANQL